MLPSYPPHPWHLSGFDAILSYAGLNDADHARGRRIVRALRRESLRRGAKLSAAKCLHEYGYTIRVARRVVAESPTAATYSWLACVEQHAGHLPETLRALRRGLRLAERYGDLDRVAGFQRHLENPSGPWKANPDSYSRRIIRAGSLETRSLQEAYNAVRRLRRQVLRLGGRATAVRGSRQLLRIV